VSQQIEWRRSSAEQSAFDPLEQAVAAVPEPELRTSLQAVADEIPVSLSVDFVNIRLLGTDRNLHLVAACGCTSIELRKRAFSPLAVATVREMLASGDHDRLGYSLGIQWMDVAWIRPNGEEVGTLVCGARTNRRPDASQIRSFHELATTLGERLRDADLRARTLRACSVKLARSWTPYESPIDGPVARLRPREQTVLELYADGLSTADIATLLVISPHTVRTHVKLALRRLGVHSRDEAATLVRSDQIAQVL
jgi:DNA-binding CsgD family transcriptional regulator